jgi:8-oxo-dGTP diphosphatase
MIFVINMERPKVGLGVFIRRNGKILFGERMGTSNGFWSCPGGHLEYGETFEECAIRETAEETGLEIDHLKFAMITNDVFEREQKHYITIIMVADWKSGEAEVKEKDRFRCWQWFDWNGLPEKLFLPARNALKQGFDPFKV